MAKNEKEVDHSYIDGWASASYWSVTEGTREWAEEQGYEGLEQAMQESLDGRPTHTYDQNGLMISYNL